MPSSATEKTPITGVARSVVRDLRDPIARIRTAQKILLEARPVPPVPEVPVAENQDSGVFEHRIRPAGQSVVVHVKDKAKLGQRPTEENLWC